MAASRRTSKRVSAALDLLRLKDSSLDRLDAARQAREAAENLELECVQAARADGQSWSKIGALYGMSKQGAQQRFRAALTPATDRPEIR